MSKTIKLILVAIGDMDLMRCNTPKFLNLQRFEMEKMPLRMDFFTGLWKFQKRVRNRPPPVNFCPPEYPLLFPQEVRRILNCCHSHLDSGPSQSPSLSLKDASLVV